MKRRDLLMALPACGGTALIAGLAGPAMGQTQGGDRPAEDQILGSADAPVTVIEYASLTCPHCAAFHAETFPELEKRYIDTGQIRFIFRDFPLDGYALRASALARCVPQGRFFAMIAALFDGQQNWMSRSDPLEGLAQFGQLAGLSQAQINACFSDEDLLRSIAAIRLEGENRFNIASTPSFVINGELHSGAQPLDYFTEVIDGLLGQL